MPRRHNKIRIPPLPMFTILTDRDDGTEWVLTHSLEEIQGNTLHISINDEALVGVSSLETPNTVTYPADEGPLIGNGLRLFVRGGRLGLEDCDIVGYAPVHTRVGVQDEAHELKVASIWREGTAPMLAFVEESPI